MWPNGSAIYLRQDDSCSFDHLVGAGEHCLRERQAELLYGIEVDDELELRRQLNRQIVRLRALEDAAGIEADLMIRPRYRGTIAHQAAALDVHTPWVDGGKFITRRKRDDFSVAGHEERIGTDRKRACPLLGGRGKGCLQIAFYVGFQHNQSQIASARCVLYMFYLKFAPVRIWMHKQCNRVGFGHHRKQQLQTFWQQLNCVHAHAGGVAAWTAQARHQAHLHGIKAGDEKKRNGLGGGLRGHRRSEGSRNSQTYLMANQIGHQFRQPVGSPPCPTVLDHKVPPFHVAALLETLSKRTQEI